MCWHLRAQFRERLFKLMQPNGGLGSFVLGGMDACNSLPHLLSGCKCPHIQTAVEATKLRASASSRHQAIMTKVLQWKIIEV